MAVRVTSALANKPGRTAGGDRQGNSSRLHQKFSSFNCRLLKEFATELQMLLHESTIYTRKNSHSAARVRASACGEAAAKKIGRQPTKLQSTQVTHPAAKTGRLSVWIILGYQEGN